MPSRNEVFEQLKRDWYGPDRADAEIAAQHRGLRPVADLIDGAMRRVIPKNVLAITKLREMWPSILGTENASRCTPLFVKEKVLHIEVAHPVCKMALDTPAMRTAIVRRTAELCGPDFCSSIKFIPRGRVAFTRNPKKKDSRA